MPNIDDLVNTYRSVYYLEDEGIIPLVAATVIANRLKGDPVWLMIVGPSSGGKSEIINMTLSVPFVHQISMLTTNTFLSGFNNANGNQSSLLLRIKNGIITMKDFTTILSMGHDAQIEIMGQMREIYDGHLVKETGTGKRLEWKGKISLIAGVTEKIYSAEQTFAQMGTRWITYVLKPQDRLKTTRRAIENIVDITAKRTVVREKFQEYIDAMVAGLPPSDQMPQISEDVITNIIELADFAALSRSSTERNYRGEMTMAISSEMPMRMASQIITLGSVFAYMSGGVLRPDHEKILYKLLVDCVPKGRYMILEKLTEHASATVGSLSSVLGYPATTIRTWLEDLSVRGLCAKSRGRFVGAGDSWRATAKTRRLISKYAGVNEGTDNLVSEDAEYEIRQSDGVYEDITQSGFEEDNKEYIEQRQMDADKLWEEITKEG